MLDITPNIFPRYTLQDNHSGLCLFGAGFYGANDAIHMYMQEWKDVTVVDIDESKMTTMMGMYPSTWKFRTMDVFTLIRELAVIHQWDVVSVDPPINLQERVLDHLHEIMWLSSQYVVLSLNAENLERLCIHYDPETIIKRTAITHSVVLRV